jgi:hypothetical protein
MNLLVTLGVVSAIFVAWFTWYQITHINQGPGQTRKDSMIEAWMNITIGFSINFAANLVFLPMVGATFTLAENFWLGWIYTAISVLRQFAIRRWYNRKVK